MFPGSSTSWCESLPSERDGSRAQCCAVTYNSASKTSARARHGNDTLTRSCGTRHKNIRLQCVSLYHPLLIALSKVNTDHTAIQRGDRLDEELKRRHNWDISLTDYNRSLSTLPLIPMKTPARPHPPQHLVPPSNHDLVLLERRLGTYKRGVLPSSTPLDGTVPTFVSDLPVLLVVLRLEDGGLGSVDPG